MSQTHYLGNALLASYWPSALRNNLLANSSANRSSIDKAPALPLLSAAWVVASIAVFFVTAPPPEAGDHDPQAALNRAYTFWQDHGYLQPDPRLREFAKTQFAPSEQMLAVAVIAELGRRATPDSPEQRLADQKELNALSLAAQPNIDGLNPLPLHHPLRTYGFSAAAPTYSSTLSHVFVFAGWLHLFAFLPLVLLLGASAEARFGTKKFALFFAGAVLASLASYAYFDRDSTMSLVGPGGPLAALAAAFFIHHRFRPVPIASLTPLPERLTIRSLQIPAGLVPAVWLVASAAVTLWLHAIGVRNDLSISAMAGGLVFGALVTVAVSALRTVKAHGAESIEPALEIAPEAHSQLDQALAARDAGDIDHAFALFKSEAESHPRDLERTRHYWKAAVSTGQASSAADHVAGQLRALIRQGNFVTAAELWRKLAEQLPDHRLAPRDLIKLVDPMLAQDEIEFASAALRQCITAPRAEVTVGLALQVLDYAETLDSFTALTAARNALEFPDLHASKRARILALVNELDPEGQPRPALEAEERVITQPVDVHGARLALEPVPIAASLPPPESEPEAAIHTSAILSNEEPSFETDVFNLLPAWEVDSDSAHEEPELISTLLNEPAVPAAELPASPDPELTIAPYLATPPPSIAPPPPLERANKPHASARAETDAPPETASTPTQDGAEVPVDLSSLPRFDALVSVAAVPTEVRDDVLYFELDNGRRAKVSYNQIQALSVAALRDISSKPVVVIDLLLNWNELGDAPLRSIRMRSDQFDPTRLVASSDTPTLALRAFLAVLLERSGALALPDRSAVVGSSFRVFKFMRTYQRRVLKVDC